MRRRRVLLLSISIALFEGCVTWKQRSFSAGVPPKVSSNHPLRVTRSDQSVILLEHPRVEGDSLFGDVGNPTQHVGLALRDVRRVEERRVSLLRTGGLIGGVAGGMVLIALAVAMLFVIVNVISIVGGGWTH